MALLQGKGSMKDVNLVVRQYDNAFTKDGKSVALDAQIHAEDRRGPGQTNVHLKSERSKDANGNTRYNNGAFYTVDQFEEIKKAAGDNHVPAVDKDGKQIGTDFVVKADLMKPSRGTGLIINTKTVQAGDFKATDKTMDNQFASMKAAKEAQKAAEAEAPAVEQEAAPVVEQTAEVDEPAVG